MKPDTLTYSATPGGSPGCQSSPEQSSGIFVTSPPIVLAVPGEVTPATAAGSAATQTTSSGPGHSDFGGFDILPRVHVTPNSSGGFNSLILAENLTSGQRQII